MRIISNTAPPPPKPRPFRVGDIVVLKTAGCSKIPFLLTNVTSSGDAGQRLFDMFNMTAQMPIKEQSVSNENWELFEGQLTISN